MPRWALVAAAAGTSLEFVDFEYLFCFRSISCFWIVNLINSTFLVKDLFQRSKWIKSLTRKVELMRFTIQKQDILLKQNKYSKSTNSKEVPAAAATSAHLGITTCRMRAVTIKLVPNYMIVTRAS
jgi:hypothetical protein